MPHWLAEYNKQTKTNKRNETNNKKRYLIGIFLIFLLVFFMFFFTCCLNNKEKTKFDFHSMNILLLNHQLPMMFAFGCHHRHHLRSFVFYLFSSFHFCFHRPSMIRPMIAKITIFQTFEKANLVFTLAAGGVALTS